MHVSDTVGAGHGMQDCYHQGSDSDKNLTESTWPTSKRDIQDKIGSSESGWFSTEYTDVLNREIAASLYSHGLGQLWKRHK